MKPEATQHVSFIGDDELHWYHAVAFIILVAIAVVFLVCLYGYARSPNEPPKLEYVGTIDGANVYRMRRQGFGGRYTTVVIKGEEIEVSE